MIKNIDLKLITDAVNNLVLLSNTYRNFDQSISIFGLNEFPIMGCSLILIAYAVPGLTSGAAMLFTKC